MSNEDVLIRVKYIKSTFIYNLEGERELDRTLYHKKRNTTINNYFLEYSRRGKEKTNEEMI